MNLSHQQRMRAALDDKSPFDALHRLAVQLKAEDVSNAQLYELFDQIRAELSDDDSPQYDAVLDVMDLITGWCRRELALFEPGDPIARATLHDQCIRAPMSICPQMWVVMGRSKTR